jgi:integrase
MRTRPVDQIVTEDVLAALRPIWHMGPTAKEARSHLERVLDAAKAQGYRSGENPARWRGHLATILPKPQKLTRGHHAAMPYEDVPEFMKALRARPGIPALCLQFTILSAARSGESQGALVREFDFRDEVWIIPGERMKNGQEHRVPLVGRALEIAKAQCAGKKPGDYLFPGKKPGRPISPMAMTMLMRRMGRADFTVHGMRSAFRDWAGDETSHPDEIAEQALAHLVGSNVRRAYRRKDALERRRVLMREWTNWCGGHGGKEKAPVAA